MNSPEGSEYPPHVVMIRRGWPVIAKASQQHAQETFTEFILSAIVGAIVAWPIRWLRYRIKYRGGWTVAVVSDFRSDQKGVLITENHPNRPKALQRKVELEAVIAAGSALPALDQNV